MCKQPFYSIIIPTYNRSKLIKPTIDSVINQSFQSFEVIIVDDFSADIIALEKVINSYQDQRIKLIKHQNNQNGAAARNTGIKFAQGKFIAFLDSDDTWPLNRLAMIKEEINNSQYIDKTIFYGQVDMKFPSQKTGVIKPKTAIGDMSVANYLFIHNGLIQTSTIVCARTLAKKVLFDERFIRHQDYDFCIRAQDLGFNFHFINQVTSHWLKHKGANVITKGANVDFCLFWLKQMQSYMCFKEQNAYKVKVIAPIAFQSGQFLLATRILATNCYRVPLHILSKAVFASLKSIIKYLLAKLK
jgi:amylovoran biosynthesis glycosyltransferase AmsB